MQICFCNIHIRSIRAKVGEDGGGDDNDSEVMMRAAVVMTLIMTMLV
jgi:hypothetical protein